MERLLKKIPNAQNIDRMLTELVEKLISEIVELLPNLLENQQDIGDIPFLLQEDSFIDKICQHLWTKYFDDMADPGNVSRKLFNGKVKQIFSGHSLCVISKLPRRSRNKDSRYL